MALRRYRVFVAGAANPFEVSVRAEGESRTYEAALNGDAPVRVQSLAGGERVWREGARVVATRAEVLTGNAGVASSASNVRVFLSGIECEARVEEGERAKVASLVARATARSSAPVVVRTPMPGKVVKVLVAIGQDVKAGQAVVVIEAMKMENEMHVPRAGRVARVAVAEGAAVEAGAELIVVE